MSIAPAFATPPEPAPVPNATAVPPACRPNPLGARLLYLRGDFNSWAADEKQALHWACNRFVLVSALNAATRFKIADDGWSADADFGSDAVASDSSRLALRGGELRHDFHGIQRITLDMTASTSTPELRIEACPPPPTAPGTLYLRGTMNNWAALDQYAFQFSCDAWYLNVTVHGGHEFKIANAAWAPALSFGASHGGSQRLTALSALNLGRGNEPGGIGDVAFDFDGEYTLRLAFPGEMPTLAIGPKTFADPGEEGVDDAVALSLRHDSRAASDKFPFGAVSAGTKVDFTLHSDTGVDAAWLVLETRRLEGNQDLLEYAPLARLPMARSAGSDGKLLWRAAHRFDDKAVYGYYFVAQIGGKQYLYGNNRDAVPWTREKGSNGLGRVEAMVAAQSIRRYRLTVFDPAYTVPEWASSAVYYYIFPDRFRNGDPGNDPRPGIDRYHDATVELHHDWNQRPYRPGSGDGSDALYNNDFFGGDLAGIIDKLDYIAGLGANTLYITPLFTASSNHKYDTADYHNIDPHFGSNADFERLTREAGKRGMRVIADVSLNHVGSDSVYFDRYENFRAAGAFAGGKINAASPYADWFTFESGQKDPDKQFKGWVGVSDLPELDKSSMGFRSFAYGARDSVMLQWLDRGAAGWRMDVAPWVPDDFWREWRSAIRAHRPDALTIAETWFDASKYFLGDMFDSTMNYIFRNVVLDYAGGGDARVGYRSLELLREAYPPQSLHALMNVLSSHDVPRTLHVLGYDDQASPEKISESKQRLRLAMFFQAIYPGAPAIFYGDEVGVTGDKDPDNRRTYPWADRGGQPDLALLADVKRLLAMRRDNPVLSQGALDAPLLIDEHVIVLLRRSGNHWALTATNNGTTPANVSITLPQDVPAVLRDALSGREYTRAGNGHIELSVPPLFGLVLVAAGSGS